MSDTRHQLREQYLHARRTLNSATRAEFEARISTHLLQYPALSRANVVAAYVAMTGEANIDAWWQAESRTVCLPRVHDGRQMTFHEVTPDLDLQTNRYGIAEPDSSAPVVSANLIDVALVPLVAFDEHGSRLGMGGGYYDRFFATNTQTLLIGIAYQCQFSSESLPRAAWDVTLDAVVHEGGVLEF